MSIFRSKQSTEPMHFCPKLMLLSRKAISGLICIQMTVRDIRCIRTEKKQKGIVWRLMLLVLNLYLCIPTLKETGLKKKIIRNKYQEIIMALWVFYELFSNLLFKWPRRINDRVIWMWSAIIHDHCRSWVNVAHIFSIPEIMIVSDRGSQFCQWS